MRVLDAIIDALGPLDGRTVVEIGPGRGVLTDRLVAKAGRVVAIELDRMLADRLRRQHTDNPNVRIVEADVLNVPLGSVSDGPYVLAGNVPYYITTPILFHALEQPRPEVAVYLVQREVAERVVAEPGSKVYGALSVNLQALATATLVRRVPPGAFTPPPTVDSAVLRVVPRDTPAIEPALEGAFRTFVQGAFGLRRKQLGRVVRTLTGLGAEESVSLVESCGLTPDVRPETLSPEAFARLVRSVVAIRQGEG